jgi:multicomponent Na+:H+ antiporter subunit E
VKKTISLTLMLFALWLLWSGHYTVMITSFGVASVLLVVALSRRMGIVDDEGHPAHLALAHLTYGPWLLWQIVLANIDVSKRVLTGDISPRWVRIKAPQKTALGRVIYANSITLTPGTTTVRLHEDQLLVHTIHKEVGEDLASGAMAKRVCALEGEH